MNEDKIGWFLAGPIYQIILIALPILVLFVSIRLTSRLRSVPIRVLSSCLLSGSIFLFLLLLELGWIFRGGWGPGNADDMYDLPKPDPMQELLQLAGPLFIFCGFIFAMGLTLSWIALIRQKKRETN